MQRDLAEGGKSLSALQVLQEARQTEVCVAEGACEAGGKELGRVWDSTFPGGSMPLWQLSCSDLN